MKRKTLFFVLPMVLLVAIPKLLSGMGEEKSRAELAKAVAEAKVSLGQGLSASTSEGKPISAKFASCNSRSTRLKATSFPRSLLTTARERSPRLKPSQAATISRRQKHRVRL